MLERLWAPLIALFVAAAGTGTPLLLAVPHGLDGWRPNLDLRISGPPGRGGHPVPERLSDLPALFAAGSGQGHTVDGVIPFEPSAKLWSDGALKERYFALPDYAFDASSRARISYRPTGGWDFPEHTVLVKNFLLPLDLRDPAGSLMRVETRILLKHEGAWSGYTYEWNEAETDATLLPPPPKARAFALTDTDGRPFAYEWVYPGRADCLACHTAAANRVLGLNAAQMNHDYTYPVSGVTENQLSALAHAGLFDGALPAGPELLPRMPDAADPTAGLEARARAYLAANCSFCHRPGTEVDARLDFRWEVATRDLNAINEIPTRGLFRGGGFASEMRIVAPGRPEASMLLARMRTLDPLYRMPRLGSRRVDEAATALIGEWITSLAQEAGGFLRGDCNGDGSLDVTDPVLLLGFLAGGGLAPGCAEACNAAGGDPGRAPDLVDALHMLRFLFAAGPPPGLFPQCETSLENCAGSACPGGR